MFIENKRHGGDKRSMENMSANFIEKARKIYTLLQDEESKEIFKKKFLYIITGEDKYWLQIIMNRDVENYKKLEKAETDKLIIYGAGNMCEASRNSCMALGHRVSYICDKDKNKQGKVLFGIDRYVGQFGNDFRIYRPEEEFPEADAIIITAYDSASICRQLEGKFKGKLITVETIIEEMAAFLD